jgi:hypothetical protein
MKVLLVHPPEMEVYGRFKPAAKLAAQPQMPLGILYPAGALEREGHEVRIAICARESSGRTCRVRACARPGTTRAASS